MLITRIQPVRRGARKIKKSVLDAAGGYINPRRTPASVRQIVSAAASPGSVKIVTVVTVLSDYISCETETGLINVAKPYLLRGSLTSRAGITYTYSGTDAQARTADNGADTEDQEMLPAWIADDQIIAARVVGGTGITDADDADIQWIDLNVDGRHWAESDS